ncbi:hypothetical protein PMI09_00180 [Rhizobium sp. CF122]|uniref:hypothetical protein n=1 Tax=Rhizobium sp. CF122 TaxID=1144312 RepID=UPI000271B9BB|nr:hypothetical protein [Rhizobium sp. CF122]EJL58470.1 hypothetical protein PMI09_00180 [Rhizobium sp. CF122]
MLSRAYRCISLISVFAGIVPSGVIRHTQATGFLESAYVASRGFQAHLPYRYDLLSPAPTSFRDSGQKPTLPVTEFYRIRDIYRVAFKDTFRVIFSRSLCRPKASGLAGGVGFSGCRERKAIHRSVQRICCRAFDQAENEGPDDLR